MDNRNIKKPESEQDETLRTEKDSFVRKDLFAARTRLYDKIKIPLKTLDIIIYALVGALILAILLGIGSNR